MSLNRFVAVVLFHLLFIAVFAPGNFEFLQVSFSLAGPGRISFLRHQIDIVISFDCMSDQVRNFHSSSMSVYSIMMLLFV